MNQVGQRTIDFPFFKNILLILFKQHLDKGSKPHYTCDRGFITLIIIIIITLFESQIILAEHECCTNWGDCKSNKSNQIKCWFLRRGENRSSRRKTSRSRVENQQTQPTYDAGSGNRTRDTLVEGERSHHYTNPAPHTGKPRHQLCSVFA